MKFLAEIALVLLVNFAGFCSVSGGAADLILQQALKQNPPIITQEDLDAVRPTSTETIDGETGLIRDQVAKLAQYLGRQALFNYDGTSLSVAETAKWRMESAYKIFIRNALTRLGYDVNSYRTEAVLLVKRLDEILEDAFDWAATRVVDEIGKGSNGLAAKNGPWSVLVATSPIVHRYSKTKALLSILERAAAGDKPIIGQAELNAVERVSSALTKTERIRAQAAKLVEHLARRIPFHYAGTSWDAFGTAYPEFIGTAVLAIGFKEISTGDSYPLEDSSAPKLLTTLLYDAFDFAKTRVLDEIAKNGDRTGQWAVPEATQKVLHRFSETIAAQFILERAVQQQAPIVTKEELATVPRTPNDMAESERVNAKLAKLVETLGRKTALKLNFVASGSGVKAIQNCQGPFEENVLTRLGYAKDDLRVDNPDIPKADLAKLLIKTSSHAFDFALNRIRDQLPKPENQKAMKETEWLVPEAIRPLLQPYSETAASLSLLRQAVQQKNPIITQNELNAVYVQATSFGMTDSEWVSAQVDKLVEKVGRKLVFNYFGTRDDVKELRPNSHEDFDQKALERLGYTQRDLTVGNPEVLKADLAKLLTKVLSNAFILAEARIKEELHKGAASQMANGGSWIIPEGKEPSPVSIFWETAGKVTGKNLDGSIVLQKLANEKENN